jgi:hypothetical protein
MSITWGAYKYRDGDDTKNGIRVGSSVTWDDPDQPRGTAVTHTSTRIRANLKIYTQNVFRFNDTQKLNYGWGSPSKTYNNTQGTLSSGGGSILRDEPEWIYTYPTNSYNTSPITAFFITTITDISSDINIVGTPTVNHAIPVPARPADYPTAPTNVTSTPGNGIVTIGFGAPTDNGGVAISYYEYKINDDTGYTTVETNPFNVNGFNGNALTIRVRAVNGAFLASPLASATSTPRTVPGVPTNVTSTPSNGLLTISYGAPTSNGGNAVSSYQFSTDGTNYSTIATNPFNVAGANGTSITVRVRAVNAAGAGAAASTTNTPRTVAGAPTSFAGNSSVFGQIALSWGAPTSNGGATITSYILRNGSTILQSANLTSFTHTGLLPYEEYSYTVTAVNASGEGNISSLTIRTLGGIAKVWNGTSWVNVLPKIWNEEEWVDAQARMWNETDEWKHGI